MIRQLFKVPRHAYRFSSQNEKANFGFKKVNIGEKQQHVDQVFHSVASNYDLMNDFMSVGLHRCWKDSFVAELGNIKPQTIDNVVPIKILDVAGGTGDIAFKILEKYRSNNLFQNSIQITVLDINQSMLDVGQKRAIEKGFQQNVNFVCANAEELPFEDNQFDVYTIAFGIRNVPRIPKALSEAFRILKQGGKFQCLEFSKVQNPLLAFLNQTYQFNLIPLMGQLIANDRASYQYLVESIEKFHNQEEFQNLVHGAGFSYSGYKNYTDGVVAVHYGFKI